MKKRQNRKAPPARGASPPASPQGTPPAEGSSSPAALHPSVALVETAEVLGRRLDLGCGQNPREGYEGVDLYGDKAKHKVDLFKFPWPFADASVDEIHCSHFLEHVPAREIEERDLVGGASPLASPQGKPARLEGSSSFLGQDMLFAFMDECWRILRMDGWMHVIVPSGRSNRAFQDPTHRRFFVQETFLYFAAEWRKINALDHYRTTCNFGVQINHSLPQEETTRSAEAQSMRFQHYWNVTVDWMAELKKMSRLA